MVCVNQLGGFCPSANLAVKMLQWDACTKLKLTLRGPYSGKLALLVLHLEPSHLKNRSNETDDFKN
jgi:hypothetical protein